IRDWSVTGVQTCALPILAAAKAKGGPTVYTKATVPDWDGWYGRDNSYSNSQWTWGTINQVSTILSVLTPEYQKRMVQMNYHEGRSEERRVGKECKARCAK